MAWEGSNRGQFTSTAAWRRFRAGILERDGHRCCICGSNGPLEVDHINRHGGQLDPLNCRTLCSQCHRKKSSAEGNAARTRYRAQRPSTPHPGVLP